MAAYCRTGTLPEIHGLNLDRFQTYRRLIFTIVQEHLEASFPVTFRYLQSEVWEEMTHLFLAGHPCQSFQVWQIAKEFYDYVLENKWKEKYKIDFLEDLLKFEWEELRLYNMEDIPSPPVKNSEGDLLTSWPVLNPEFALMRLEYPVHIFSPDESLKRKGDYILFLFRERETGRIQFMDVSPWHAFLIEQFSERNCSLEGLLTEARTYFPLVDPVELEALSLEFLTHLKNSSFILGFK